MRPVYFVFIILLLCISIHSNCQSNSNPVFKVVPLGVKGGIDESNLSAYMLAINGTNDYICLDAGTLHTGIQRAIDDSVFKNLTANDVLRRYIKGYCISHAHIDHLSGLIINSPDDTSKKFTVCLTALMC